MNWLDYNQRNDRYLDPPDEPTHWECDRCSGAGWIYIDELTPAETRDMLESKQEY